MSLQCLILFDENIHKVYYSGQLVKGTVLLTLPKDQPVRGIYIEITGMAKCRWCEHVQQKRMTYRGSEIYLSAKKYFVGSAATTSASSIVLPMGEHVYTFTCPLPKHLPTSFEGTFGSIRYKAEVTLNLSIWPDKSFSEGFTVIKSLDLNGLDGIRNPVTIDQSDTYNIWCCCPFIKSKPINIMASITRSGFTSGQNIEVFLDIQNNSNMSIRSLSVCLLRIVVYCANERFNHHKTEHVRYSEIKTRGCKSESNELVTVALAVPAGPPSDGLSSVICRIRYEVEIKTDIGPCRVFPTLRLPVIIGTFPLLENSSNLNAEDPRLSVISYDPDLPSYEQAIAMNPPEHLNELTHVPVYPTFEPAPPYSEH